MVGQRLLWQVEDEFGHSSLSTHWRSTAPAPAPAVAAAAAPVAARRKTSHTWRLCVLQRFMCDLIKRRSRDGGDATGFWRRALHNTRLLYMQTVIRKSLAKVNLLEGDFVYRDLQLGWMSDLETNPSAATTISGRQVLLLPKDVDRAESDLLGFLENVQGPLQLRQEADYRLLLTHPRNVFEQVLAFSRSCAPFLHRVKQRLRQMSEGLGVAVPKRPELDDRQAQVQQESDRMAYSSAAGAVSEKVALSRANAESAQLAVDAGWLLVWRVYALMLAPVRQLCTMRMIPFADYADFAPVTFWDALRRYSGRDEEELHQIRALFEDMSVKCTCFIANVISVKRRNNMYYRDVVDSFAALRQAVGDVRKWMNMKYARDAMAVVIARKVSGSIGALGVPGDVLNSIAHLLSADDADYAVDEAGSDDPGTDEDDDPRDELADAYAAKSLAPRTGRREAGWESTLGLTWLALLAEEIDRSREQGVRRLADEREDAAKRQRMNGLARLQRRDRRVFQL